MDTKTSRVRMDTNLRLLPRTLHTAKPTDLHTRGNAGDPAHAAQVGQQATLPSIQNAGKEDGD